ncbi:MAG: hypothetical protein IH623_01815 [Verrucomicrobia bacterium]|nr:hypothetical protein [Verrucomicrobiota bacterium]
MKNRNIFIDFENVQPKDLALLKGRDFRVMIFIGSTQAKLPTEFAIAVQALGDAAEYVKIDGSGRNALDFHVAYYLGCASVDGSAGESFVISKDTGFEPLMRHLKAKGISCRRLSSISEIPGVREAAIKPSSDPIQRIIANLAKRAAAKPRTVKTLRSSIKHLLGEQGTEEAVNRLVGELERLNAIKITDSKVTYPS